VTLSDNTCPPCGMLWGEWVAGVHLPSDAPLVWADRQAVRWMLEELVRNAWDAIAEAGRVSINVEKVKVDPPHPGQDPGATQFTSVVVTDTGRGMGREVQKHLGEPFFTTNAGKRTGLGLASVSGLIQAHGGWLAVTSAPGHGTRVRLFFPCAWRVHPGPCPLLDFEMRQGCGARGEIAPKRIHAQLSPSLYTSPLWRVLGGRRSLSSPVSKRMAGRGRASDQRNRPRRGRLGVADWWKAGAICRMGGWNNQIVAVSGGKTEGSASRVCRSDAGRCLGARAVELEKLLAFTTSDSVRVEVAPGAAGDWSGVELRG